MIFQHDNAPSHSANITTTFLEENNIQKLNWPPYSPDMNIIEHVWAVLKQKVRLQAHTTRQGLIREVQAIWDGDQEIRNLIGTLYDGMNRRVTALLLARGGYTRY